MEPKNKHKDNPRMLFKDMGLKETQTRVVVVFPGSSFTQWNWVTIYDNFINVQN